jgi:hypothetical protein
MLPLGEKEMKAREEMLARMNLEEVFTPIQQQLEEKGYKEYTAEELWRLGKLNQVGQQLEIIIPDDLPEPPINRYTEAINMFRMALLPFVAR